MRDWLWGLALPAFLVATLGLALTFGEWGWFDGEWLVWVPAAIGGGLVASLFVVAGFIAPPSSRL